MAYDTSVMVTIPGLVSRLARAVLCLLLVAAYLGQGLSHASETASGSHPMAIAMNAHISGGDGATPSDDLPDCAAHGCVFLHAFAAEELYAMGREASTQRIPRALTGTAAPLPDKPPRS